MSAIPSWCRVGAEVVYIGRPGPSAGFSIELVVGATYRVREVFVSPHDYPNSPNTVGIRVAGIVNIICDAGKEIGYKAAWFRPVHTLEDDITTHFSALLDVREPVGA